jgi:hypothetical protein
MFSDASPQEQVRSLLGSVPAKSIIPQQGKDRLKTLGLDMTLRDAMSLMALSKISGAPVFDDHNVYSSSLTSLTLAAYLEAACDSDSKNEESVMNHTLAQVVVDSKESPMIPFFQENPSGMLLEAFAQGHHRVALFSSAGECVATCSSSDLLQHIASVLLPTNEGLAAKLDGISVGSLLAAVSGEGHNVQAQLVHETATVAACLPLLTRAFIGVPNDAKNSIVTHMSPSDLRGFSSIQQLRMQTVSQFVGVATEGRGRVLSISRTASVAELLKEMAKHRLHQIWVVGPREEGRQGGSEIDAVSLTDVMKWLSSGTSVTNSQMAGDYKKSQLWRAPPNALVLAQVVDVATASV